MLSKCSPLQSERYKYTPKLPAGIAGDLSGIRIEIGRETESVADRTELKAMFPNTYGLPAVSFTKGPGDQKKEALTLGTEENEGVVMPLR